MQDKGVSFTLCDGSDNYCPEFSDNGYVTLHVNVSVDLKCLILNCVLVGCIYPLPPPLVKLIECEICLLKTFYKFCIQEVMGITSAN